jgi:Flp pilus assembly CpaE family ATPase
VVQSLLLANKDLLEEISNMEVRDPKIRRIMEKWSGKTFVEERRQGMQQMFDLLKKGMSFADAEKMILAK